MATYLAHYGIKGMKWGVRNEETRAKYAGGKGWRHSSDGKSKASRSGLSSKQKAYLKRGAVAAGIGLAIIGGVALYKSGHYQSLGKVIGNTTKSISAKTISEPLADSLKFANPHRGTPQGKNSCGLSEVAGVLRTMGHDVQSRGSAGEAKNLNGLIEECFKGAKTLDGSATKFGKSPKDAADMLLKRFGPNASGAVSVDFNTSSGIGHVFHWETVNGKTKFCDFDQGSESVEKYWKFINQSGQLQIARLDNAEPNWENLSKYVARR